MKTVEVTLPVLCSVMAMKGSFYSLGPARGSLPASRPERLAGAWFTAGGASVATPIVAGLYALAGNATTLRAARHLYRHRVALFDVISGGNGACGGSYLCTATAGYDGPSGLGTPNGLGAFQTHGPRTFPDEGPGAAGAFTRDTATGR